MGNPPERDICPLTTARTGRQAGVRHPPDWENFHLTTSRRGRRFGIYLIYILCDLSTHDLTQRSTAMPKHHFWAAALSTHDLTQRSTILSFGNDQLKFFQLTTSRRGRPRYRSLSLPLKTFQLTTSRRGRQFPCRKIHLCLYFQLTTSRRGRPQYFTYFMQNFDPISYIFHKNHFK